MEEKMDNRIIHFNVAISILLNENDSNDVINGVNSFCKEHLRKINENPYSILSRLYGGAEI